MSSVYYIHPKPEVIYAVGRPSGHALPSLVELASSTYPSYMRNQVDLIILNHPFMPLLRFVVFSILSKEYLSKVRMRRMPAQKLTTRLRPGVHNTVVPYIQE